MPRCSSCRNCATACASIGTCRSRMDDGLVLRADVFRPVKDGQFPVILTYGPYAKDLAFQDGYPSAWNRMAEKHPDVTAGSSNLYQSWEVVDPEKWVPHDYVCVRVDSRGAGCSPGFIDHFSPRETKDFYDCIEWAGVQPWSNGKVGLNGISYYGMNQWHVASLQPPHLAAMCVWEGSADWYRDMTHHGGILSTFWENWYDMQVKTVQYGARRARRAQPRARRTGMRAGDAERGATRQEPRRFRRQDPRPSARRRLSPRPLAGRGTKVVTPLFSAANWGGQGLHPRGNFEGFVRAASKQKWLEAHGIEHWTHFYTDYGREQQLEFFDYFLHGKDSEAGRSSRRCCCRFVIRAKNSSRARRTNGRSARTQWTKFYLDPASRWRSTPKKPARSARASPSPPWATASRSSRRRSRTTPRSPARRRSSSPPRLHQRRRLFHRAARVHRRPEGSRVPGRHRSAHADRARLAARLAPQARQETVDCRTGPITRTTRSSRSPKGKPVELDIEIWPTSIVVPAGYRVGLSRSAARTTNTAAPAAASCPTSRTNSKAAARSCTTIRATGRPPFSTAPPPCISAAGRRPICCCRSSRRKN